MPPITTKETTPVPSASTPANERAGRTKKGKGRRKRVLKLQPGKKVGKMVGTDYNNWAFRGLTFVPPDCTDWLLEREYDGPLNVFDVSKGFFPMLTG